MAKNNHPIQPLELDPSGVLRFKSNAIVKALLAAGPYDMNRIAEEGFSREDQEQFAQLIGYSWSGAGDLSYMSARVIDTAMARHEDPDVNEWQLRAETAEAALAKVKKKMLKPLAALYGMQAEDVHYLLEERG